MPTDGGAPAQTSQERDVAVITRAAEWAVTNKYLTALTRFATPICIAAVGWVYTSVTSLVAHSQDSSAKITALESRLEQSHTQLESMRIDLTGAREQVIRLQSAQESTASLARRLDEFRQDLRDIRVRLDQIAVSPAPMTPSFRYQTPQQ